MRKVVRTLTMCGVGLAITMGALVLLSLAPSSYLPASQAQLTSQASTLQNPGFGGTYEEEGNNQWIAPSWHLWYTTDWTGEGSIASPKAYTETTEYHGSSPAQALAGWNDASNFDACVYQQVSGITVGHWIRFSAWVKVTGGSALTAPDHWQTRLGIDPDGGTNPLDINYYTHQELWDTLQQKDQWTRLRVHMKATSPTATLYACSHPIWPSNFRVYWDDAAFAALPETFVYMPNVNRNLCYTGPGELFNPDLEEAFCNTVGYQTPISGYANVLVAPFWLPFWNDNYDPDTWENAQPEYNMTDRDYRRYSGLTSQQHGHSAWGNFEAGIYQVITGTEVGDTLRFTIYGLGWIGAQGNTNDHVSDYTGADGLRMRVGIDPYGGQSYTSTQIIWSGTYDPYDVWHQFEITATAQYTRVSVWAYAHPMHDWAYKYRQVFWDDASWETSSP